MESQELIQSLFGRLASGTLAEDDLSEWFSEGFLGLVPAKDLFPWLCNLPEMEIDSFHVSGSSSLFIARSEGDELFIRVDATGSEPTRIAGFSVRPAQRSWIWGASTQRPEELRNVAVSGGKAIEDLILRSREENHVPGMVVRLSGPNGLIHAESLGTGNMEDISLLEPSSVMRVGSIAKVLTAIGVIKLAEEKALGLDDPAAPLLDDVKLVSHPDGPPISIRHLLSHSAGIARTQGNPTTAASIREMLGMEVVAKRPAGASSVYSNLGFTLLGLVVEHVTGSDFASWMKESVLDPLGMRWASFASIGADLTIHGYEIYGDLILQAPRISIIDQPAGALCASMEDLEQLSNATMLRRFLSPSSWDEALSAQGSEGQGLGFLFKQVEGTKLVWHNGGLPGWKSFWGCIPEREISVALAGNAYPVPLESLGEELLRATL